MKIEVMSLAGSGGTEKDKAATSSTKLIEIEEIKYDNIEFLEVFQ